MNRIVFYLLVSFFGITDTIAQGKLFKEESDGFKWYSIWTDDYKYSGAQDILGNDIIPLYKYRYVSYSSEYGVFQIVINEEDLQNAKFGYCTKRGRIIVNPEQVDKSVIVKIDGTKNIKVSKQDKYGVYSLEGKVIVPCEYDDCTLYSRNVSSPRQGHFQYFGVKRGGKEGVYDLNGKLVIPVKYKEIRYNDWDDRNNGFEGKLDNDVTYRKLNISIPIYNVESPNANTNINNVAKSNGESSSSNSNNQASAHNFPVHEDYGTNSKHGKILNRSSEQHGTATFTRERYEDGYSSIFIMDKCKACGGTGKVGFNFCTAGCAMGITTLLTYYDQNGNEVESTGTMANHNNPYSSGGSGGSYSGGSSSGSSSSSSSVYTKCTSCNGTGRCSSCNGRGYKFNSYAGHDDECPSCRGKGSCPICYGRGKL